MIKVFSNFQSLFSEFYFVDYMPLNMNMINDEMALLFCQNHNFTL